MSGSLIFHHNGAGDYVMSVPAMRALTHYAPRPIHIVCGAVEAAFLYEGLAADRLIRTATGYGHFEHRFDPSSVTGLAPSYEWFISLAHWRNDDVLSLKERSRARWSAGLFPHFDLRPEIMPHREVLHEFDRLFALAQAIFPGAVISEWLTPLEYPAAARAFAAEFSATLPDGATVLTVHADTRPEKVWPLDRLDTALATLTRELPRLVIVVLNLLPEQLPLTAETARARFLNGVPLAHAMAVTSRSHCFLGVDSCMLHVADLHRIPGVALFGPTDPRQFGYRVRSAVEPVQLRMPSRTLRKLLPADVVRALCGVIRQL
jgi:ADP-heptose:LPS heptosyltransferase